ncbi:bifunctional serine/threonine protein kinase/MFS transporter [Streptomyces sp. JV184]|uniref:bifunctional serine/threonine protein kinase/MFS transporter n=1 Tax=Streptomyces sp. JV184 TaxID=858637 RepID=UPI002E75C0CE|nr:bifunctional serine/threonine protein kinase/MFS transporter [Streptomyces sp. JV184]
MDQLITEDPPSIGPYRLIARLGAGGMGLVYLGRSEAGRTVAVKVVQAEYAQHPEFRRRFAREVAAARRVGGTWTAAVLDADTEAPVPWVATQYIPGPDLTTVVAKDFGPLPEHSVRTLANRLATALESVHGAGLIHRDLKPSNVLVTVDGPRVIDFGIARAMDSLAGDSLHTRTGMLIGSPGFMSPEQVRGLELTPASDVFCLGAVLVYAATGRLLFGATETGLNAHLFRIAEEEADLTGVPESLVDLVRACLHKDPAQRPTPAEVAARTAAGQDGEWLPGTVLAQLGRHAAQLLDFAPEARAPRPDPRIPAQPGPSGPAQPVPPQPAYIPTTPAGQHPAAGSGAPAAGAGSGAAAGPAAPPFPDGVPAPHPMRWWGLGMASLAQLLVLIGTAVTNAAMPAIYVAMGLSSDSMRLFSTVYMLGFGVLLLLGGHLSDLLGRKRVFVIGSAGLAAACTIGGLASSSGLLILANALQGMSAALLSSSALALVSAGFADPADPKERGRAFGIYAAVAGSGMAFGMFAGAWLTEGLSWRWSLYATAGLALLLTVCAAPLVHDPHPVRTPARADVPGLLLGTAGLTALAFGFDRAQVVHDGALAGEGGWTTPLTLILLVGGALLLGAFVWRQAGSPGALVPARLLGDRNRVGSLLALLVLGLGLLVTFLVLTRYLQVVLEYPVARSGTALLPMAAAAVIAATQVAARLCHRLAPRNLIVPGLLLTAAGLAVLTGIDAGSAYTAQVLPGTLLIGFGAGLAFTPLFATATDGISPQESGGTSAVVLAAQNLGGWAAWPLFGTVLASTVSARLSGASDIPAPLAAAAEAGVPFNGHNLPESLSGALERVNAAVMDGYSAVLWWTVGLTLLASLLAALMITARAPQR